MMVEIGRVDPARVLRVEPEPMPQSRFPLLDAVLWWTLPAVAMLAGGWTAAMVLIAAGRADDPTAVITCVVAEAGVVPSWSASAGWVLTAGVTGALVWRAHTRRPPLIRTAEPVVTPREALDELTGATGTGDPGELLVRERGELRVAAVTHVQHDGRRSRGNSSHIPAPVLRAYLAAVDGAGGY